MFKKQKSKKNLKVLNWYSVKVSKIEEILYRNIYVLIKQPKTDKAILN